MTVWITTLLPFSVFVLTYLIISAFTSGFLSSTHSIFKEISLDTSSTFPSGETYVALNLAVKLFDNISLDMFPSYTYFKGNSKLTVVPENLFNVILFPSTFSITELLLGFSILNTLEFCPTISISPFCIYPSLFILIVPTSFWSDLDTSATIFFAFCPLFTNNIFASTSLTFVCDSISNSWLAYTNAFLATYIVFVEHITNTNAPATVFLKNFLLFM